MSGWLLARVGWKNKNMRNLRVMLNVTLNRGMNFLLKRIFVLHPVNVFRMYSTHTSMGCVKNV